ncbi:DEAD/DEAH box helicase [Patescibacteria group bacterium AH-259-L07]|nr:DEAD/DEAH box helicase [Patescibacteria group bacterium AH-259-L07]
MESAKKFLNVCDKHTLSVYLERSRSGNGGHVWCFFEEKYPAYKSRQIFFHLLRKSKNIDALDKEDSFDRLFPNQDYHSGKGLGNLIALPLQGKPRKKGNSVFLSVENDFKPAHDQWNFFNKVEKVSTKKLDGLFEKFTNTKPQKKEKLKGKKISVTIAEYISIPKLYMSSMLANFLREELNFLNSEYIIKQKIGVSVYKIEKYFKTVITDDGNVLIPRGFLSQLVEYFKEHGIDFVIQDKRNKLENFNLNPTFELFDYQKQALDHFDNTDSGVLVAPPGSGKTVMGLELIARKKQPALILTHRKQIYNQWVESIENFLGIPKKDIGQFAAVKKEIKYPITTAMAQTLARVESWESLTSAFGLLLVDECHHMPARMFRDVVTKFNTYYLYGLTATPKRKHNDEKLIYAYLGNIVHEISRDYKDRKRKTKKPEGSQVDIITRETNLSLPFSAKTSDFQTISKILTFDPVRNSLIYDDVTKEAGQNNTCLILTERKEHVDILHFYLKRDFEVLTLTGDMTPKKRKQQERQIQEGNFQILIATGQLFGEGSDISNLDCLFLVFPFSFEGKLIQYIGRIERGEDKIKKVYDYRDSSIEILEKLFKKRKRYYNKIYPVRGLRGYLN